MPTLFTCEYIFLPPFLRTNMRITSFAFFGTTFASFCSEEQVTSFLTAFESAQVSTNSTEEEYVTAVLAELASSLSVSDWQSSYHCYPCMETYLQSMFACQQLSSGCEGLAQLRPVLTFRTCSLDPSTILENQSNATVCSTEAYDGLVQAMAFSSTNISASDYVSGQEYLNAMVSSMGTSLSVSNMSEAYPCYPCLETLLLENFACINSSSQCNEVDLTVMMTNFRFCAGGEVLLIGTRDPWFDVETTPVMNLTSTTETPSTTAKAFTGLSNNWVLGTFITALIHSTLLN